MKGLIEREEQRRANLAGEEPKVLFVEDVEGGGGVGRGVFYTGLSREKIDIPYLRRPYRRASSTYVAQAERALVVEIIVSVATLLDKLCCG